MHGILRMLAILLSLTVATALPGAHDLPLPAAAAGCHHQPANPSPAPRNYQCCASGHDAAMPSAALSLLLMASHLCGFDHSDGPRRDFVRLAHFAVLIVPSNSPPGIAPLRI
jgi:hypothetical protein